MNHYAFEKLMAERQRELLAEAARNRILPCQPSSLARVRLGLGKLLIGIGLRLQGAASSNTPAAYR